ncbi:MAG: hypothetical protein IPK82_30510 [Polyangiaceae bacterium]|nr:hypothetical protein [Polyangiaceae bacterium]
MAAWVTELTVATFAVGVLDGHLTLAAAAMVNRAVRTTVPLAGKAFSAAKAGLLCLLACDLMGRMWSR